MKKIIDFIKKLFGISDKSSGSDSSQGFTLIELLIVIAVIGVLAAATLVSIDPVDKINAANDSSVQKGVAGMATGAEAYAAAHNGFYPNSTAIMVTSGDLRTAPSAPGGYSAYVYTPVPAGCTSGVSCTGVTISGQLKSKKYVNAVPPGPVFKYESSTGKKCAVATAATACP